MRKTKSYSELIRLPTFKERFDYLKLGGVVGHATFGFDRYANQALYRSKEWKLFRRKVILRDESCDLGCKGYEINGWRPIIHHINPLTIDDVLNRSPAIFDMENVVTTILPTHNAIHYSDKSALLIQAPIERRPNDTCPWR